LFISWRFLLRQAIYREEEREMIPLCIDQGVGLIPWSPLARGFFNIGCFQAFAMAARQE
jgi:hypothetical protein